MAPAAPSLPPARTGAGDDPRLPRRRNTSSWCPRTAPGPRPSSSVRTRARSRPSAAAGRWLRRAQLLQRTPFDLEVGAGVAHDPGGAQVQEGRAARATAVFDRFVHVAVAVGQVEAV